MAEHDVNININARDKASSIFAKLKSGLGEAFAPLTALNQGFQLVNSTLAPVIDKLNQCIDAALESDAVFNRLRGQLERNGYQWQNVEKEIDRFTRQFLYLTTFTDEQAAEALNTAAQFTRDLGTAQKIVATAADLATAKQMDLTTATNLLGKAYKGHTEMLSRYGIVVKTAAGDTKSFSDIMAQLNQQFGGAAQKELDGYAGKLKSLQNQLDEYSEAVGRSLLPLKLVMEQSKLYVLEYFKAVMTGKGTMLGALEAAKNSLEIISRSMTDKIKTIGEDTKKLAEDIADRSKVIGTAMSDMARKSIFSFEIMNAYVNKMLSDNKLKIVDASVEIGEASTTMVDEFYDYIERIQRRVGELWIGFADLILAETSRLASGIADIMIGAQNRLREVFKAMARDFLVYFINAALKALAVSFVTKLLKILASLFDTRVNDLMAMRQGADFAKYFSLGMENYFKSNSPARSIIGSSGIRMHPSSQNIINIGMVIGQEDYVRKILLPQLESAVSLGRTPLISRGAAGYGRY